VRFTLIYQGFGSASGSGFCPSDGQAEEFPLTYSLVAPQPPGPEQAVWPPLQPAQLYENMHPTPPSPVPPCSAHHPGPSFRLPRYVETQAGTLYAGVVGGGEDYRELAASHPAHPAPECYPAPASLDQHSSFPTRQSVSLLSSQL